MSWTTPRHRFHATSLIATLDQSAVDLSGHLLNSKPLVNCLFSLSHYPTHLLGFPKTITQIISEGTFSHWSCRRLRAVFFSLVSPRECIFLIGSPHPSRCAFFFKAHSQGDPADLHMRFSHSQINLVSLHSHPQNPTISLPKIL